MKKIITILACLFISCFAFSQGQERYLGISYDYTKYSRNYAQEGYEYTDNFYCNGLNFSMTPFFNNNWGFLLDANLNIITGKDSKVNNYTFNEDDYLNFSYILSFIVAPEYKYNINDNIDIYGALGLHFAQMLYSATGTNQMQFSLGLGLDAGFRYFILNKLFFNAGCLFSYDFLVFGEETTTGIKHDLKDLNADFISLKPYIGIGFIKN